MQGFRRAHERRQGDAGDTLIEVLISLAVIGIAGVALLGGFTTSISASTEHRNLAAEDTVLKAYIESVTHQLSQSAAITGATVSGTTVTITATGTWITGDSVVMAGLANGAGTNWVNANGTFTILAGGTNTFTYTVATNTPTSTSNNSGTASSGFDSQCNGMTSYAPLAKTELFGGITYSLTVTDPNYPIMYWVPGTGFTASGCAAYVSPFATPPQQQLLTAEISGSGLPTQTISFAISDPAFAPGSAAAPTFQSASTDSIVGNSSTWTFAVSAPAYPTPSLSMSSSNPTPPSWVIFVDNTGGSGTLYMTPSAANASATPYTIQLNATNSLGTTSQTFTITVSSAPLFTSAPNYVAQRDTAFTFPVTATGIPSPTISESSTLPAGVSFSGGANGTGTLSGTSAVAAGTYTIDFSADSSGGNTPQVFTLTVNSATPPSFTSAPSDTVPYKVPFSFTVSASGAPNPAITESGALPTGVSFAAPSLGSATISGSPTDTTPTMAVNYPITLTASSAAGTVTLSFLLTVNPKSSPTITSTTPSPPTGTSGAGGFSFTVHGTGFIFATGVTVTFSSGKITGSVTVVNSTTLTIAATATKNGSYSYTIMNPDGGSASSPANVVVS